MNLIKSLIGRRQFLFAAGAASASMLALKKLAGFVDPVFKTHLASAAEKSAGEAKASFSSNGTYVKKMGDLKCVIIYLSLTGNTEKIARAIQKGIEQAAGNCDIIPLKDASPYKLEKYDLIGFGNPIMGAMRHNIYNFIKNLRYVGGKHLFLFSTAHAGGNNFNALFTLFKEHGLIFIGGKAYHGAEYGPMGEPCPTAADGHPDKIDCEDAEAFGKQMVENSRLIYAGNTTLIPEQPKTVEVQTVLDWKEHMKMINWRLIYDKSKCLYPKCRLCMDYCPVHGIDLTVDPPVLTDPCLPCGMCDQVCPTGAATVDPIQMRWQNAIHDYEKSGRERLAQLKQGIKQEQQQQQRPSSPYGPTNSKQYLTDEQVAEGFLHQVYKVFPKRPRFIIGYGRPYGVDPRTLEDRGPAPENWPT